MRPNQISFWRLALQQGGADLTAHERVIAKVIAAYDAALADNAALVEALTDMCSGRDIGHGPYDGCNCSACHTLHTDHPGADMLARHATELAERDARLVEVYQINTMRVAEVAQQHAEITRLRSGRVPMCR